MQIIIEGLALAAFQMLKSITKDPLLKQLLHYVVRDEARHVTFGINYLEDYLTTCFELSFIDLNLYISRKII